jgi:hypothetical protein
VAGASAFRQTTRVLVDREFSPAARSRALATMAKRGLADLLASGRASRRYRTFVDGQEGRAEESVSDRGVILYEFQYLGEVVAFAIGFLQRRAPVKSGRFRAGFFVSVDGRFLSPDQLVMRFGLKRLEFSGFQPDSVPPGAEIIIGNKYPQNRKVDVQIAGGHTLRFTVPSGMYDDAARAIRRQFGNTVTARRLASVRFPGQYVARRGKGAGSAVQSPGLLITALR